jgi:hypothetical protein
MGRRRMLLISSALAAAVAALVIFGLASSKSGPVGSRVPALPSEKLAGS